MKPSIFITGAGGFLGNQLLAALDVSLYETIYCLCRKPETLRFPGRDSLPGNVEILQHDLLDITAYQHVLDQVETVVHMAAATGKVSPAQYARVNSYATILLLDRCRKASVKNFLFVSSIAVAFKNKYRYFYALAKEEAEKYVTNSELNFTILRPTMIMGKGAPVFEGLAKLACLPFIPMFGKGDVEIQPVDVQDVAKAITHILENSIFKGDVLELGGPQKITIESFMKKIAVAAKIEKRNREEKAIIENENIEKANIEKNSHKERVNDEKVKPPAVLHLPLNLIIFILSIMERAVYAFLPLTVGQLATFRNDGTAKNNSLMETLRPSMVTPDQMIQKGLEKETADIAAHLEKECRVLSKYLMGAAPNNYVLEKYNLCHGKIDFEPTDFHDALLLKLAGMGFFFTRMADAYSRFFRSNSTIRKKLAYLMAIIEVTPPCSRYYDSADGPGLVGFIIKAGLKGVTLALHLLVSVLFLLPLQVLAKLTKKKAEAVEN
ncbi:MAG: NAD-dependent epimerase/dehydratase family protein [bacterium]|nr:NAD-dependent epimerase/dehydratase family protein [bacterium]